MPDIFESKGLAISSAVLLQSLEAMKSKYLLVGVFWTGIQL